MMEKTSKYKYNEKVVSRIIELITSDNYTITEICHIVGIATRTYYDWTSTNPDFAEAIENAKEERMQFFVAEAKKSLLKKIQGYTVDETKVVTVPSKELDENGRPKPRIKEQTTVKKHIAPDTAAVIFTLTNGEPETWRNRQYSEITGKGGKDLIKQLPDDELDKKIADLESKIKE